MSHTIQRTRLEKEIYLEATRFRDRDALTAFLDETCGDDLALRTRIESLLEVNPRSGLLEPDPVIREVIKTLCGINSDGNGIRSSGS